MAQRARAALVVGLLAGLGLPGVAAALRGYLPELIATLLFVNAVRIGPGAALGSLAGLRQGLFLVSIYQGIAPLVALAGLAVFGVLDQTWALLIVLVLSAPALTGAANFTIMLGRDPALAMRLMLLGTALFPLTAVPVLWLAPGMDGAGDVLSGAARLIVVIFGVVAAGFALRSKALPRLTRDGEAALDGLTAMLLAVIVVGLMSAVGPALRSAPADLLAWLAFAVVLNFGLQSAAAVLLAWRRPGADWTGASIAAGNRNVALFLVALPETSSAEFLLFIGCYQVPMYLTPLVMRRIVAR